MTTELNGRRIFVAQSKSDLERCYPVLKELRTHLSFADFMSIYEQAHRSDGYELVAIEDLGQVVAVMGYRFLSDFIRGKHVYIDDLVSTAKLRSRGLGVELLKFAEAIARESECKSLRLCTGIENERGVAFYDRNGWTKRAYAYTKKNHVVEGA